MLSGLEMPMHCHNLAELKASSIWINIAPVKKHATGGHRGIGNEEIPDPETRKLQNPMLWHRNSITSLGPQNTPWCLKIPKFPTRVQMLTCTKIPHPGVWKFPNPMLCCLKMPKSCTLGPGNIKFLHRGLAISKCHALVLEDAKTRCPDV